MPVFDTSLKRWYDIVVATCFLGRLNSIPIPHLDYERKQSMFLVWMNQGHLNIQSNLMMQE
jgi:hypothetical protein